MYVILFIKTKDPLNPNALFLLFWLFTASLSSFEFFYDQNIQKSWSIEMKLVVLFSAVAFFIPSFFLTKFSLKKSSKNKLYFSYLYRKSISILFFLGITSFFIRFRINKYVPTLFLNSSDIKHLVPQSIPILNYFELLLPYLSLVAIFEIIYAHNLKTTRKYFLIFIYISGLFYSLFYLVSRGSLIIIITGTFYIIYRYTNISTKKIVLFFLIFIILTSAFSIVRLNEQSLVLNRFDNNNNINMIASSIYTYTAYNFENLRKLVDDNFKKTGILYSGKFLLYPFFKNEYQNNVFNFIEKNTIFFNARTYLYGFYHDLGFFGIILYPFLLGIIITLITNISYFDSYFILIIALLQKAIYFSFFGNYFFGELVIFFPYFILFLILNLNKFRIKNLG